MKFNIFDQQVVQKSGHKLVNQQIGLTVCPSIHTHTAVAPSCQPPVTVNTPDK